MGTRRSPLYACMSSTEAKTTTTTTTTMPTATSTITTTTKPVVTCKWSDWMNRDSPYDTGDCEIGNSDCQVEKYEVGLVSGGVVYTNVDLVPVNILTYNA